MQKVHIPFSVFLSESVNGETAEGPFSKRMETRQLNYNPAGNRFYILFYIKFVHNPTMMRRQMKCYRRMQKMNERIKQLRHHFGLSQAQFAQRIQRSPGLISSVESGRSGLSDKILQSICEIFDVNYEWLAHGKGDMFQPGKERYKADRNSAGKRIREIRKEMYYTQKEFAEFVECSVVQIRFVECGRVHPSNEFLYKLAVRCGVRYDWLITGEGEQKPKKGRVISKALIRWLKDHPEVIQELQFRSGVE